MPRSKTMESRNTFTGSRKLSKKVSKQGKKITKQSKKISDKSTNTTEEMLDMLSTESKDHSYKGKKQQPMQQQPMQQQPMQQPLDNIDPLMISNFVPTNNQGEMYNINKIGDLLGMTQIGNPVLSTDSTIQNPIFENQMGQQLSNQLMQPMQQPMMQQPMMQQPMMQQPMMQQPMMQQPMMQQPMMQQPMMQQPFMGQQLDDNFMNTIKSVSELYKTPKLA